MPIVQTGGTKQVPPEGSPTSRICLVGEAPGATEAKEGRPFVPSAPAGGKLAECMQRAQLARRECYITNVFKVPVQKRGSDLYINRKRVFKSGYGFEGEGLEWLEKLRDELQYTDANVIVAMGESAIYALTGLFKPTKVRGSIVPSTLFEDRQRKVVCCIHPAGAAQGNYIWTYYIIYDLRKAVEQSEFPEIRYRERNYIIEPDLQTVIKTLERYIDEGAPKAIDLEAVNHEVSCFGIGDADEVLVVPFTSAHGHYWSRADEAIVWRWLDRFMGDERIVKVLQNATFDLWMLSNRMGITTRGPIRDTMVAMKQLYPDYEKGLDTIASIYTDEPYYKEDFKVWKASPHEMRTLWEYNAKDVAVTYESWEQLANELHEADMWDTFEWTMRLIYPLVYMETRGVKVNKSSLKKLRAELEAREIQLQAELNELAGFELNPNSSVQLKKYFYETKNIPPFKNRKTGKPSCDDNALKRLAKGTKTRKPFKEASLIREIRSIRKLYGTYLNINLDDDGRLRCSINPAGTETGRLSTGKTLFGNGTNMQNLPQQFKQFLEADPGNLLWEIDKAQGEWVIVAFLSGDANMMEIARTGVDAHTATAKMAFGVPEELIKKENKVAGHETDPVELRKLRQEFVPEILEYSIPGSMTVRQAGKKSNHGLNYDMRGGTFGMLNEVPDHDANFIVEAYHQGYPGIRNNFHAYIREQIQRSRTIVNLFGRKRRFLDRWSDNMLREGYAQIPQSTLVDLVNRGMVKTWEDTEEWYMWAIDMLMQVHDSIFGQYPVVYNYYRQMAKAIIKMGEYLNPTLEFQGREFQIRNDVKVGLNWAGYSDHNPLGMMELEWTEDVDELAESIWDAHTELIQNQHNL